MPGCVFKEEALGPVELSKDGTSITGLEDVWDKLSKEEKPRFYATALHRLYIQTGFSAKPGECPGCEWMFYLGYFAWE